MRLFDYLILTAVAGYCVYLLLRKNKKGCCGECSKCCGCCTDKKN